MERYVPLVHCGPLLHAQLQRCSLPVLVMKLFVISLPSYIDNTLQPHTVTIYT